MCQLHYAIQVSTCVINGVLYNEEPCGWKLLPRNFGEIGGSNVKIDGDMVKNVAIFDRALMTNECREQDLTS